MENEAVYLYFTCFMTSNVVLKRDKHLIFFIGDEARELQYFGAEW